MTMFFGFHENMQTYKPSKLLLERACKIIYFRYFVIFFHFKYISLGLCFPILNPF